MQQNITLGAYIRNLSQRFEESGLFYGHGTDNAWDEAVYLVFAALGVDFGGGTSEEASRVLSREELSRLNKLADRRIEQRVPVAYLVGEAWFAGIPFHCDERALVPRSPIAELIIGEFAGLLAEEPQSVLDLCSGSGCIGLATAMTFPDARVDLSDISAEALALASSNTDRHGLAGRVRLIQSDLFENLTGPYDLILSNPPYVSQEEVDELPPEYHSEPALGLLSQDEGLAIPLQILRQAADYLTSDGLLIMEVGYSWQGLAQRLPELPVMWIEFANGGEGVFAIRRDQLLASKHQLEES